MNRKSLTTAILAGITGIAGVVSVSNAVHVNPDNSGQVLIYPYYTTRADNVTLISIVNTTVDGKAVKVRFLEGVNSAEVLDFNLYLSPFDVWTASIIPNAAGGAQFVTTDNSCTVPYFFDPATGTSAADPFTNFTGTLFQAGGPADNGPQDIGRVQEGYVEMIEMGVVNNVTPQFIDGTDNPDTSAFDPLPRFPGEGSLAAITHNQDGPVDFNGNPLPADCDQIVDAFSASAVDQGYFFLEPQTDMSEPTGGLFGGGVVINVPGARAFGYDATALDGFFIPLAEGGDPNTTDLSLHTLNGTFLPNLASAFPAVSTTYLSTGNAPTLVTDSWPVGFQAVTASLMVDQVMNQYSVEAAIAGGTEWIITHPTKRFHTFGVASPVPPFTTIFPPFNSLSPGTGSACEFGLTTLFDRNEFTPDGAVLPSPFGNPSGSISTFLCYEANVLSFGGTPFLGSENGTSIPVDAFFGIESGWAQLAFNGDNDINTAGSFLIHQLVNPITDLSYRGLPVVGMAVQSADAPGAQFAAAFEHTYGRIIVSE